MEVVLGIVCVFLALLQAALVVFLVKYVADAEERAQERQAQFLEALAKRDTELFDHLRLMNEAQMAERDKQRQELQNILNRIQDPITAVATTVPPADKPSTVDYMDEERELELERNGNAAVATSQPG